MRHALVVFNSLLQKEIRNRMRAKAALVLGSIYIITVCLLVFFSLDIFESKTNNYSWEIGKGLFSTLIYGQVFIMFLLCPIIAATAITSEKEQRTFHTLCVTPISSRQIIYAKLSAILLWFYMLIFISIPLVCIAAIFGGIELIEIVILYIFSILYVTVAGSMGLYWSTRFKRNGGSITAACICVFLAFILTIIFKEKNLEIFSYLSPAFGFDVISKRDVLSFYTLMCPSWIPLLLLLLLLFFYFMKASTLHLQFQHERRFALYRAIIFSFYIIFIGFMAGEQFSEISTPESSRNAISYVFEKILIILTLCSPLLGANLPSLHSVVYNEKRSLSVQILYVIFTRAPYCTILLLLCAVPFIVFGLQSTSPMNLPDHRVWLIYFGIIGLSTIVWTLLSNRLAGNHSIKRRILGMVIVYLISGITVILPAVLLNHSIKGVDHSVPRILQFFSLLSPATSLYAISKPLIFNKYLPEITAIFGEAGFLWVTTGIYALFSTVLLLLPVLHHNKRQSSIIKK